MKTIDATIACFSSSVFSVARRSSSFQSSQPLCDSALRSLRSLSSPFAFCSIWLASAPPTEFNWLTRLAPGLRIWPNRMLNCSVRLGHLLTCSTCGAVSALAVHHAAAGLERLVLVVPDQPGDFLGQADDVLAAPADGRRAAEAGKQRRQRRAFGGPGRHAVLDHQHLDVLAPQLRPQTGVGVGVQADHVHQQRVVDVLQPLGGDARSSSSLRTCSCRIRCSLARNV